MATGDRVEIFTVDQFVEALAACRVGNFEAVGIIDGEEVFRVFPHPGKDFGIEVRSSIGSSGKSDAAGKDSIRPVIVMDDNGTVERWGGKARRWIPRTSGWREALAKDVAKLAQQIAHIAPCGACGFMVKPFVVKKAGPTKGRPFVKCCNDDCPGPSAWVWADEPADDVPAPVAAPMPTMDAIGENSQEPPAGPVCKLCAVPMVRMASGKGWKCANAGQWDNGARRFKGCNESQFDDRSKCPPPAVQQTAARTVTAAVARPASLAAAFDASSKTAELLAGIRVALAHLDDDNPDEAGIALRALLK